jgi:hypothetical protein
LKLIHRSKNTGRKRERKERERERERRVRAERRMLHNEQFHDFFSSPGIIRIFK